jgi:hypothetical protein
MWFRRICADWATSALFAERVEADQMPTPVAPLANPKIAMLAKMILCWIDAMIGLSR